MSKPPPARPPGNTTHRPGGGTATGGAGGTGGTGAHGTINLGDCVNTPLGCGVH